MGKTTVRKTEKAVFRTMDELLAETRQRYLAKIESYKKSPLSFSELKNLLEMNNPFESEAEADEFLEDALSVWKPQTIEQ